MSSSIVNELGANFIDWIYEATLIKIAYPYVQKLLDELMEDCPYTEQELFGHSKRTELQEYRAYLAYFLRDETVLTNEQIGILLNRTPDQLSALYEIARPKGKKT